MDRILFFLTIEELRQTVMESASAFGFEVVVRIWKNDGNIPDIRVMEENFDAIVCRGFMYEKVAKLHMNIPVINCPTTIGEYIAAVYAAKQELGLEHPKVFRLGKNSPEIDSEKISLITGVDYNCVNVDLEKPETILQAVKKAKAESADGIICGPIIEKMVRGCEEKIPVISCGVVNEFSRESVLLGFQWAAHALQAVRIQSEKDAVLENMIQYSFDAVISLDASYRIKLINSTTEDMFQINGSEVRGCFFFEVFPQFYSHIQFEAVTEFNELFGKKILIENQEYVINIICFDMALAGSGKSEKQYIVYIKDIENSEWLQNVAYENSEKFKNDARFEFHDIIGQSQELKTSIFKAKRFAEYDAAILIMGESGTGKEMFAQSIHNASSRKNARFVAINCAAVPVNLLESELFGYTKGAFTGALREGKKGLFEIADHGTLFLDEITEMDLQGQKKLLRVLSEKKVRRIGDEVSRPVNVRVIAATNKDVLQMIEEGKFLEDLFYRLNILSLRIPPLRERKGDIRHLVDYFIHQFGREFKRRVMLDGSAYSLLEKVMWRGNVRQLRNFCERMVIISERRLVTEDMVREQLEEGRYNERGTEQRSNLTLDISSEGGTEREKILKALNENGGKRAGAADALGISLSTLYRKMKKYGIVMNAR